MLTVHTAPKKQNGDDYVFDSNKHFLTVKTNDYMTLRATVVVVKGMSDISLKSFVSEAVLTVVRHVCRGRNIILDVIAKRNTQSHANQAYSHE